MMIVGCILIFNCRWLVGRGYEEKYRAKAADSHGSYTDPKIPISSKIKKFHNRKTGRTKLANFQIIILKQILKHPIFCCPFLLPYFVNI